MVQHTCGMNNDFKTVLRLFVDLCLIKKGPQDVPDSTILLKAVFFIYFLSGSLLLSSSMAFGEAVVQSFIETILLGLFVYILLSFFALKNRFNQSVTAIYGSGALITVISAPFVFLMGGMTGNEGSTGVLGLVVFLIVCWSFAVLANIIRQTIQKSLGVSLLLTFCYLYLSYHVIQLIYPVEVALVAQ
ncbi:hypothetical protein CYCME_0693 [Cycloclasticus zancles 78-ME]|uniref:Yip1 domain-containing protein n=2 Tax=Piscirickettsiaceae TaxID=135616 RepID=S5T670_9GAMM|nr:hypothetical protein CYCME_0693 [Cycloclasticus zancles 78-ME]SHI57166.1 hypothetical protein SAMN05519226_0554 [Cycloclasticus pugetii]